MKNKTVKIKGKRKSKKVVISEVPEYIVEYRKGTKWNQRPDCTYRYMSCKLCGHMTVVGEDTQAVTCHHCVNEMVEGPQISARRISSGRPAGWHFMAEYVDKDGNVFHKGKEQPKLKGTIKPSVIEKKQKISKNERNAMITAANVKVHKLKKQLSKAKLKKDIKRITREIAKNSKIGKGKIPRSMRYKQNNLDKS
tara:strand:- start:6222 stop:6806 length:585 start_codon:yes stop_codon:yes gene_type:complete